MPIVVTNSLYLSGGIGPDFNSKNPIIGWHSVLRYDEIIADTVVESRPSVNMWNPDTSSVWEGASEEDATTQYIELINTNNEPINYVGVAKHNLGSVGYTYSIEHTTDEGSTWSEVTTPRVIASNDAIMDYFDEITSDRLRIKLTKSATGTTIVAPIIAHVRMGVALILQRRIFVGHKPANIAKKTRKISNGSASGQYLGSIVTRSYYTTDCNQTNNTPAFVRQYIKPFIDHVSGAVLNTDTAPITFFFAWRPGDYPDDVVYGWTNDNIEPENSGGSSSGGLMSWNFSMECVA